MCGRMASQDPSFCFWGRNCTAYGSRGIVCCASHQDGGAKQLGSRSTYPRLLLPLCGCHASRLCHYTPLPAQCKTCVVDTFRPVLVNASDSAAQGGPCGDRVVDRGHHHLGPMGKHSHPVPFHVTMSCMQVFAPDADLRPLWGVSAFAIVAAFLPRVTRTCCFMLCVGALCLFYGALVVNGNIIVQMAMYFAGGVCFTRSVADSESGASHSVLQEWRTCTTSGTGRSSFFALLCHNGLLSSLLPARFRLNVPVDMADITSEARLCRTQCLNPWTLKASYN